MHILYTIVIKQIKHKRNIYLAAKELSLNQSQMTVANIFRLLFYSRLLIVVVVFVAFHLIFIASDNWKSEELDIDTYRNE